MSARRWLSPGRAAVKVSVCDTRPAAQMPTRTTSASAGIDRTAVAMARHGAPETSGNRATSTTTAVTTPAAYVARRTGRARQTDLALDVDAPCRPGASRARSTVTLPA